MGDRSSAAPPLRVRESVPTVAFVRGPGLAEAEVDFVSAWSGGPALRVLGPDACELPTGLRPISHLLGMRGDLGLVRLSAATRRRLEACDGLWLPDPWLPMSWHAACVARRRGLPYVVTVWENLTQHPSVRLPGIRSTTARVLRGARLVHCVTVRSTAYVIAVEPDVASRMVQVYPGVDLRMFTPEPSTRPQDGHRFLFVGRLVPEKGVRELLTAFERLRGVTRRAELWVVGAGPLVAEVQASAARVDGLRFLGFVPRRLLPDLLRSCHTLVLPSKQRRVGPMTVWEEQFGFVLIEAMASGLDIIAARSGSIPEVVADAGVLLHGDDLAQALLDAMRASVESHEQWEEASQASRGRAKRHFDAGRNAQVLLSAVEAALTCV